LDEQPKLKKMDMRFGTWNIRSMYRASSLRAVAEEISKYVGESNENRKTQIKIRNIAPLSYKLTDMLPMLYRVIPHHEYPRSSGRSHLQGRLC
jgi:hypothetical protein